MAKTQVKQPTNDDGKVQYLNLNKAKYITINDGEHLKYAKTGSKWLVWYDPIYWVRNGDGSEIESKFPDAYDDVRKEIESAINNQRANVSSLSFKEQTKKKEDARKAAKASADTVEKANSGKDHKTNWTTPNSQQKQSSSSSPNASAGKFTEPKRDSSNTSPSGRPVAPPTQTVAPVQYHGLSDAEMLVVYTCWFKLQGRSGDVKKSFIAKKASGELIDELDQFMQFGLFHKGVVPDNLIPPLPIIKKMLSGNDDLILYYERKLNKGKTAADTPEERLKAKLKSGAAISKAAMPKSFQAAFGAAKIGLDIGRVGLKVAGGLSNKIGDAIGKIKSPLDGKTDDITQQSTLGGESSGASGGTSRPSMMSIARDRLMGTRGSDTDKTTQYMSKQIGEGLRGIKDVLMKRLPEKSSTRAAENKTFANEAELTDKTKDMNLFAEGKSKGSDEKSKGGIFAKIGAMFSGLLSPLKMFGKVLGGLVGFIPTIGKALMSMLSGISSSLMPMLRAVAPAAAVAAAAYAGYKGGQALFKATGTLDEQGNLSQDSMLSKMNDKLTGSDASQSTSVSKQLKDMSDDELNSLNAQRKVSGRPALDKSEASQKLRDSEQRLRAVSKSTDVTAAPKSNSAIVNQIVNEKADGQTAKENAKSDKPIIVSMPQNNTSVGGSCSPSIAMNPRTSNSTFQRYNDSRTRFSYA